MILVDTSVWVSHLREGNPRLVSLLNDGDVVCHPFIIGELSCGNLRNRSEILSLLRSLPMVNQAEHEEVLQFVESNDLMGRGLGYAFAFAVRKVLNLDLPAVFDRPYACLDRELRDGIRAFLRQQTCQQILLSRGTEFKEEDEVHYKLDRT